MWGWAGGGVEIVQFPLELLAEFHVLCLVPSLCSMRDLAVSEWLAFKLQMEGEWVHFADFTHKASYLNYKTNFWLKCVIQVKEAELIKNEQ